MSRRLDGLDAARGAAIVLMVIAHTVNALVPFADIPAYGVIPVQLVTQMCATLFVLIFGVTTAMVYLPQAQTPLWPAVGWRLVRRGFLVLVLYKALTVVELFETARAWYIADTLLFRRFPRYVEPLHFFGWALVILPAWLSLWRRLSLGSKMLVCCALAVGSFMLDRHFGFWGIWQLEAVLIGREGTFCYGLLTHGALAATGMLLGEIVASPARRQGASRNLAQACLAAGFVSLAFFYLGNADALAAAVQAVARGEGQFPPATRFVSFAAGGALVVLGACLMLGSLCRFLLWPLVAMGRAPLFCFGAHIVLLCVGYRWALQLRGAVSYLETLGFAGATLLVLACGGALTHYLTGAAHREVAATPLAPRTPRAEPSFPSAGGPGGPRWTPTWGTEELMDTNEYELVGH